MFIIWSRQWNNAWARVIDLVNVSNRQKDSNLVRHWSLYLVPAFTDHDSADKTHSLKKLIIVGVVLKLLKFDAQSCPNPFTITCVTTPG